MFLKTVGDIAVIPAVLAAAERGSARPSDEAMRKVAARQALDPLFV